jgi:hypothetical protein
MKQTLNRLVFSFFAGSIVLMAAKVVIDYNHKVDFSQYRTYSWLKVEAGDPLWPERITSAIDSELADRGWSKVPDNGEASLAAFASSHTQPRLETFYEGFDGWVWRGLGDGFAVTTVDSIPSGTLVVDIFDSTTKRLIWRGTASDALSDKPDKNEMKLERAAAEMFKHFPPKSRG